MWARRWMVAAKPSASVSLELPTSKTDGSVSSVSAGYHSLARENRITGCSGASQPVWLGFLLSWHFEDTHANTFLCQLSASIVLLWHGYTAWSWKKTKTKYLPWYAQMTVAAVHPRFQYWTGYLASQMKASIILLVVIMFRLNVGVWVNMEPGATIDPGGATRGHSRFQNDSQPNYLQHQK